LLQALPAFLPLVCSFGFPFSISPFIACRLLFSDYVLYSLQKVKKALKKQAAKLA
jgi:hypothetical protein